MGCQNSPISCSQSTTSTLTFYCQSHFRCFVLKCSSGFPISQKASRILAMAPKAFGPAVCPWPHRKYSAPCFLPSNRVASHSFIWTLWLPLSNCASLRSAWLPASPAQTSVYIAPGQRSLLSLALCWGIRLAFLVPAPCVVSTALIPLIPVTTHCLPPSTHMLECGCM